MASFYTSDDFSDRSNELNGTATNLYDGGSAQTWVVAANVLWRIDSTDAHRVTPIPPGGSGVLPAKTAVGVNDYLVQATLTTLMFAGGVIVRHTNDSNFYAAVVAPDNTWLLYKRVAAVDTVLFTSASFGPTAAGDVISLQCVGSRLTMYRNGSALVALTDTAHATGDPGIGSGGVDGSSSTTWIDKYRVTTPNAALSTSFSATYTSPSNYAIAFHEFFTATYASPSTYSIAAFNTAFTLADSLLITDVFSPSYFPMPDALAFTEIISVDILINNLLQYDLLPRFTATIIYDETTPNRTGYTTISPHDLIDDE